MQPVERHFLARQRRGVEPDHVAIDRRLDGGSPGDHPFQGDPPQPAGALREVAGDVDRKRGIEILHRRQREIAVVAVAVIAGEAGEATRKVLFRQPSLQFVGRDDVDVGSPDISQRRAQEVGVISRWRFGWNRPACAGRT